MTTVEPQQSAVPARYRHPRLILIICCTSLLLVSMDAVAINVALPSISRDLHAGVAELQWSVDAYTLVLASLLMLSGSTSDRIGRRRTFQIGVGIFTLGSLLCSLAPSVGWLIAFRMVQAVGGSMMNPVAMSIITATFPDRAERAKAVGIWSAVIGISMGIGPIVGGALTETVGWRGIFWINVPIGIAAIVLTAVFIPESRSSHRRRFDPVGQLLMIVMLASLVAGLIEAPRRGWTEPESIVLFTTAAISLAVFVAYERRRREPLIDIRFFRSLPFSSSVVTAVCTFTANGAFLFIITLYLQEVRQLSPLEAGVHTLPFAVAQLICAPLSGRLVASRGTRPPVVIAAVALAAASGALTLLTSSTPMPYLLVVFFVFGVAMGLLNAPITTTAVSGMPASQTGAAAAIASTSRQVGTSLGIALAGALTGIGASTSLSSTFAEATAPLWWTVVGLSAVILFLGVLATGRIGRRSTDAIAFLFGESPTGSADEEGVR
ncbi:DHA2 family efflux MFS transporter permease subunit [Gordonia humi]|uniref:EmrB/QacA subfamily drug resistance transporter n=1 Tax=Gordonia humi TaxID=686429 RepID=A0A840EYL0_9ACTN|nr:DHA2 family efflux MFS transporter permease subunit [Gordonia humi]MBB4134079.1 EmrB/QacA subfamily drug resistance transporter [Gordonia humi]